MLSLNIYAFYLFLNGFIFTYSYFCDSSFHNPRFSIILLFLKVVAKKNITVKNYSYLCNYTKTLIAFPVFLLLS